MSKRYRPVMNISEITDVDSDEEEISFLRDPRINLTKISDSRELERTITESVKEQEKIMSDARRALMSIQREQEQMQESVIENRDEIENLRNQVQRQKQIIENIRREHARDLLTLRTQLLSAEFEVNELLGQINTSIEKLGFDHSKSNITQSGMMTLEPNQTLFEEIIPLNRSSQSNLSTLNSSMTILQPNESENEKNTLIEWIQNDIGYNMLNSRISSYRELSDILRELNDQELTDLFAERELRIFRRSITTLYNDFLDDIFQGRPSVEKNEYKIKDTQYDSSFVFSLLMQMIFTYNQEPEDRAQYFIENLHFIDKYYKYILGVVPDESFVAPINQSFTINPNVFGQPQNTSVRLLLQPSIQPPIQPPIQPKIQPPRNRRNVQPINFIGNNMNAFQPRGEITINDGEIDLFLRDLNLAISIAVQKGSSIDYRIFPMGDAGGFKYLNPTVNNWNNAIEWLKKRGVTDLFDITTDPKSLNYIIQSLQSPGVKGNKLKPIYDQLVKNGVLPLRYKPIYSQPTDQKLNNVVYLPKSNQVFTETFFVPGQRPYTIKRNAQNYQVTSGENKKTFGSITEAQNFIKFGGFSRKYGPQTERTFSTPIKNLSQAIY
jgi:hypothetical protein